MPLSLFIVIWLVFLLIHTVMGLLTASQMLRLGIAGMGTYLSTILFLAIIFIVILATGSVLIQADWSEIINPLSWFTLPTIPIS